MKTKIITGISIIMMSGMLMLTTACNKEAAQGRMTVKMTDAPADYLAVNVEITGLSVNTDSKGWITLPVHAGTYDLLTLQNNLSVVLADSVLLPAGHINQIRLELGANNTLMTTTGTFALTIPGGSETGLKVNIDKELRSGDNLVLVLDFDAGASVVEQGNGSFSLKPVITLKSAS